MRLGCCAFYFCTHAGNRKEDRQPIFSCCFKMTPSHTRFLAFNTFPEIFVPAGHVGLLMDEKNDYLLASPGMHNIRSCFTRVRGPPKPINRVIEHGDRTIVTVSLQCVCKLLVPYLRRSFLRALTRLIMRGLSAPFSKKSVSPLSQVDQGNIGFAMDNGMPVLLPQGIHCWTSDSLHFVKMVRESIHPLVTSLRPRFWITGLSSPRALKTAFPVPLAAGPFERPRCSAGPVHDLDRG